MNPKNFLKWIAVFVITFVMIFGVTPFLVISILVTLPQVLESSGAPALENQIAVLELSGVITDSKDFLDALYKQVEDDSVKGIVVRIDSPGGAVGPAQEIYSALYRLRDKKPIIASMGTVAASGGLYVALGASKILCQPGTLTGSIGVIVQIPNFKKVVDLVGVDVYTIKSGELKDAGNSFRAMTEREREFLQSTVDVAYGQFVDAVTQSRSLDEAKVREFADGRLILGSQAIDYGIADGYGDVQDAARMVFEQLGTPLSLDENPNL
ncbi:MAG: signal peptide peptidase SppA, partial [Bdellovibrionales bacterium]|nr:signal peptide peptidase SppA [Bdellovibrionales bacterium]